jgi:anti-sigma regulatory factor (Ser/Thr protein kinase)
MARAGNDRFTWSANLRHTAGLNRSTGPTRFITSYQGTFHGRADELARVRKEIAAYLGECPAADDLVLIADELAANSILHTKSRAESLRFRCELSPGSVRLEVDDMGGPCRMRKKTVDPTGSTSWKR